MDTMNGYTLSRYFWDFAFENTGKIKPIHVAIYFFAMEHCNRLGWKKNFGLPTSMVLEAISVKSYSVYKKAFDDLAEFNLFEVIQYSKNQYSSNIIALKDNCKATTKALDKALQKHGAKQGQSIDSIVKQETIEQETIEQCSFDDFWNLYNKKIDRSKCLIKWNKIKQTDKDKIFKHIPNYIKSQPEIKYRKNPLTYLNGECWNDEIQLKPTKDKFVVW